MKKVYGLVLVFALMWVAANVFGGMFCPECQEQGLRSEVYPGMTTRTLAYCQPFYDEEGNYHHHDSNVSTTEFSCSNDHSWETYRTGSCWCGWPEKIETGGLE